MSEYFSNFPRIQYDINGTNPVSPDYTVAINLMVRQKIQFNIMLKHSSHVNYCIYYLLKHNFNVL